MRAAPSTPVPEGIMGRMVLTLGRMALAWEEWHLRRGKGHFLILYIAENKLCIPWNELSLYCKMLAYGSFRMPINF